jgi:hypothetical protein
MLQVLTPLELVQPLLSQLELVVKIFLKVVSLHHLTLILAVSMALLDVAVVVFPLGLLLLVLVDQLMTLLCWHVDLIWEEF